MVDVASSAGTANNGFHPGSRLITALDVPDRANAETLLSRLGDSVDWIKIGLELFVSAGPDMVRDHAAWGRRIMLDLKLHDIPTTVARATARAAVLGAELLTVHAAGGGAMLRAACDAARDTVAQHGGQRLRILAVTALTSLDQDDLHTIGIEHEMDELVARRAALAVAAGCDGVVASPHEAARLRDQVPQGFLLITPGIRPVGSDSGDQKRVMTPRGARALGADLIVCGRPIRDAPDPAAVARAITIELMTE